MNDIVVQATRPAAPPAPAQKAAPAATAAAAKAQPKKKAAVAYDPGEYLVMGELLRRGYEAQLADRNVKDYQVLAGSPGTPLKRIQVKTVRMHPWPVNRASFDASPDQLTVYVLLGPPENARPARFFVTWNREVADQAEFPDAWSEIGSMKLKPIEPFENTWDKFRD